MRQTAASSSKQLARALRLRGGVPSARARSCWLTIATVRSAKATYPNGDTFEGAFNEDRQREGDACTYTWNLAEGAQAWVPEGGFPGTLRLPPQPHPLRLCESLRVPVLLSVSVVLCSVEVLPGWVPFAHPDRVPRV